MNTTIRQYDGRDLSLICASQEDRIDALKRAIAKIAAERDELRRQLERERNEWQRQLVERERALVIALREGFGK
jgi:hypothetical protein